ncbi:hypothetical protein XH89_11595 [Bradyrhizobium sp. CCBAU 53340]|nr:hypothetical protein XH89_11595 [Bradyrhizobium sp. CCBAU 53340]
MASNRQAIVRVFGRTKFASSSGDFDSNSLAVDLTIAASTDASWRASAIVVSKGYLNLCLGISESPAEPYRSGLTKHHRI